MGSLRREGGMTPGVGARLGLPGKTGGHGNRLSAQDRHSETFQGLRGLARATYHAIEDRAEMLCRGHVRELSL